METQIDEIYLTLNIILDKLIVNFGNFIYLGIFFLQNVNLFNASKSNY